MLFVTLIIRNLIRRKMRTLLTVAGISIGITAVVTLVTISEGFEKELIETFQARGTDLIVMKAGTADVFTSSIDEALETEIEKMGGVAEVAKILFDLVAIEDNPGLLIYGWDPEEYLFQHINIAKVKGVELGRLLKPGDENNVIMGKIASDNFRKKVGDDINIETDVLKIVGIYESNSILESGSLIMPLKKLQELMDRENRVTVFNIRLNEDAVSHQVKEEIERKFSGLTVMEAKETIQSNQGIRMAKGMAWATSLIALLVGAVGTLNTMSMSVFERTREIGVLRAVGWRKKRVMVMILMESVTMGFIGWIIGLFAGKGLLVFLSNLSITRSFVRGDVPLFVIGEAFIVAIALGIIGGIYPAFRGANLSPMEALRYE